MFFASFFVWQSTEENDFPHNNFMSDSTNLNCESETFDDRNSTMRNLFVKYGPVITEKLGAVSNTNHSNANNYPVSTYVNNRNSALCSFPLPPPYPSGDPQGCCPPYSSFPFPPSCSPRSPCPSCPPCSSCPPCPTSMDCQCCFFQTCPKMRTQNYESFNDTSFNENLLKRLSPSTKGDEKNNKNEKKKRSAKFSKPSNEPERIFKATDISDESPNAIKTNSRKSKAEKAQKPKKSTKSKKVGTSKSSETVVFKLSMPLEHDLFPRSNYPKFNQTIPLKYKTSGKAFDLSSSKFYPTKNYPSFHPSFSNSELNRLVYKSFIKTHEKFPVPFGLSDKNDPRMKQNLRTYQKPVSFFPYHIPRSRSPHHFLSPHSASICSILPHSPFYKSLQNSKSDTSVIFGRNELERYENTPQYHFTSADDPKKEMKRMSFNPYYRNNFCGFGEEPYDEFIAQQHLDRRLPVQYNCGKKKMASKKKEKIPKKYKNKKKFKTSKKNSKNSFQNLLKRKTNNMQRFRENSTNFCSFAEKGKKLINKMPPKMKQEPFHTRRFDGDFEKNKCPEISKYFFQSFDSLFKTLSQKTCETKGENVPNKTEEEIKTIKNNIREVYDQLEMLNEEKNSFKKKFKSSEVLIQKYLEENLPKLFAEICFTKVLKKNKILNNYMSNSHEAKLNAIFAKRPLKVKKVKDQNISKGLKPFDYKIEPQVTSSVANISTLTKQQNPKNLKNGQNFNSELEYTKADVTLSKKLFSKNSFSENSLCKVKNDGFSSCLQQLIKKYDFSKKPLIPLLHQTTKNFEVLNSQAMKNPMTALRPKIRTIHKKMNKSSHKKKISNLFSEKPQKRASTKSSKFPIRNYKKPSSTRLSKLSTRSSSAQSRSSLTSIIELMSKLNSSSLLNTPPQHLTIGLKASKTQQDLECFLDKTGLKTDSSGNILRASCDSHSTLLAIAKDKKPSFGGFYQML